MSFNSSFDSEKDISTIESTTVEKPINTPLLSSISQILSQVIKENKTLKNFQKIVRDQSPMVFSATTPPQISLFDYLYRIKHYGEMEDNTLIIALIFIDRLCDLTGLTLTPFNIHRVLFASILTAVKYNEDMSYDNKYYADIAGVSLKELTKIESSFVDMMGFNFYVEKNLFEKYQRYLKTIEEKKEFR